MINRSVLTALVLAVCCAGVVSCSSIKHVEVIEFLELASETRDANTMRSTLFIGASGTRAYIERWRMPVLFGSGITVYWTSIEELPQELATQIKAGIDPWKGPAREEL